MATVGRDEGGHIVKGYSSHCILSLLSAQQKVTEVCKNPAGLGESLGAAGERRNRDAFSLAPECFSQRPSQEPLWRPVQGAGRRPGFRGPHSCLVIHRLQVYEMHTHTWTLVCNLPPWCFIFSFLVQYFYPHFSRMLAGWVYRTPACCKEPKDAKELGGDEHIYQAVIWPPESWSMTVACQDACSVPGTVGPRPRRLPFNALHTVKAWVPRGHLTKEHDWNKNVKNRHWAGGQLMK